MKLGKKLKTSLAYSALLGLLVLPISPMIGLAMIYWW